MKIAVVGTRGFPGVQGGVESHCEKLYPLLVKLGCEVTVFTRKGYADEKIKSYEGVNLIALDCPKSKHLEAISHTFAGILAAAKLRPDILHIHAIGPALLTPVARMLGMKVVLTHHGPDYKRKKWNFFARSILMLGETLGIILANEIIAISRVIADDIRRRYNRLSHLIPNGIDVRPVLESEDALRQYALNRGKYVLAVGRFVPEKGFDYLIDAFKAAAISGWKLVIAGKADHETAYSRALAVKAAGSGNTVLTGFLSGKPLQELYSHAGIFVLPSYYEGLPIALLEAMSYGLLCVASGIPANRCVELPENNYFTVGDTGELSKTLKRFSLKNITEEERKCQVDILRRHYDWDNIAHKTMEVYRTINRM